MIETFFRKIGVLAVVLAAGTGGGWAELSLPVEPTALEAAGIRDLQAPNTDLDGTGVAVAMVCRSMSYLNGLPQNDYRVNMRHNGLADADVVFEDHSDGKHGISPHATAIAGVLIGLDPHAAGPDGVPFTYQGVSPFASVDVYEFWRFAALRVFTQEPVAADIITLSLGDVYESWWTRGLERLAAENGTIIVAAVGNGENARDPLLYPAAGANVIGVGVIDSALDEHGRPGADFAVPTARHSSRGPTDDRRSKPDLVAPGTALVPDAFTENGYRTLTNATSLAAPITAGTAALLLQYARDDETLSAALEETPVNCVIKAVLMNAARKLPYWHKGSVSDEDDALCPLDRLQGAGALDALAAMEQLVAGRHAPGDVPDAGWDSRILENDEIFYYVIDAADPTAMLTATLTWNRHFEPAYPFRLKPEQSDLRLEVWGLDADDRMVLLDVSDSPVDNVEHLWTPLAEGFDRYVLAVRFSPAAEAPMPDSEPFALAWSVGPDTSAGHPLWRDLNGDGKVDSIDRFIEILIDNDSVPILHADTVRQALNLSQERINLLTAHWHRWKPRLATE